MNHSSTDRDRPRKRERVLTEAAIVDLAGYDGVFLKECEKIFQINAWLDGSAGRILRDWLKHAVCDIVELYSLNPGVLMGSLNMGPDLRSYDGLLPGPGHPGATQEQIDAFDLAYKTFALNVADHLTRKTEPFINEALRLDFSDVEFTVIRYRLGCVTLAIRGITPRYPDTPYPSSNRIMPI